MVSDEQEMHEKPHHILDWVTDSVDLWALGTQGISFDKSPVQQMDFWTGSSVGVRCMSALVSVLRQNI